MRLKYITALASLVAFLFVSCEKETIELFPTTTNEGMANLKIVHAMPLPTNSGVQLKVNGSRVSNNITYSTPFPSGGLNTGGSNWPYYLAVQPGSNEISVSFPKAGTNIDSVTIFTTSVTVDAGKYYSLYLADTASLIAPVLVEDNRDVPAENTSRYKFVNLIRNQPGGIDLYFGPDKVASAIAYKAVSPEFVLARAEAQQWIIRAAGAAPTATPIAVYPGTVAAPQTHVVPNKRIYTVYARGFIGVTTGHRVPAISLTQN